MIGDFEDLTTDRQHRSSMPNMYTQATITCAEGSAFSASCGATGFHQRGAQPAIAAAGFAAAAFASTLMITGTHAGPAGEMRGAGEVAHVDADFGHQHLGGAPLNARDRDQTFNRRCERGQQLLDAPAELGAGFLEVIDVGQQAGYQEAMVSVEATGQVCLLKISFQPKPGLE